jgi:outer membrane protein OmpU
MRRFLLAATAIVGATAGLSQIASAQTTYTVSPPPPPATSMPAATPLPGTVQVRFKARLVFDAAVAGDSGYTNTDPATGIATKLSPGPQFQSYVRLFPGFDGQASNGLKYGASIELRQSTNNNAGGLPAKDGLTNPYYFRETGYVGTDRVGTFRFGQTDSVTSLFMTGTMENWDYEGGWNGDAPDFLSPGTGINWVFPENDPWDNSVRVVYLSPRFGTSNAGFDFGVSYSPSETQSGGSLCPAATNPHASCQNLSSISGPTTQFSTITASANNWRNEYDIVGRFTGAFGAFGVTATVGYIGSGVVQGSTNGTAGGSADFAGATPLSFKKISAGDAGIVLTFGGLAVGGHYTGGMINGNQLIASGQPQEHAWIGGASYAFGPFIVGFHVLNQQYGGAYAGSLATATNPNPKVGLRVDKGISAGGTYSYAPGANLYLTYIYGNRTQRGFDFINNAASQVHNRVQAQAINIGNVFDF